MTTIDKLLNDLGLTEFKDALIDIGLEDEQTLLELTKRDLEQAGVKKLKARSVSRQLRALKSAKHTNGKTNGKTNDKTAKTKNDDDDNEDQHCTVSELLLRFGQFKAGNAMAVRHLKQDCLICAGVAAYIQFKGCANQDDEDDDNERADFADRNRADALRRALDACEKSAEHLAWPQRQILAKIVVALALESGDVFDGPGKDAGRASELMAECCSTGHPIALFEYALMWKRADNDAAARAMLVEAGKKHYPPALLALYELSPAEHLDALDEAVSFDYVPALLALAAHHERAQQLHEAARARLRAAQLDHVGSMVHIGHCFANGAGVARNDTEAARWWRLASSHGATIVRDAPAPAAASSSGGPPPRPISAPPPRASASLDGIARNSARASTNGAAQLASAFATASVPHDFHVRTFKSPTYCDVCGSFVYGVLKQGRRCRICSCSAHHQCAMTCKSPCQGPPAKK
jgi:TPR repeat protein